MTKNNSDVISADFTSSISDSKLDDMLSKNHDLIVPTVNPQWKNLAYDLKSNNNTTIGSGFDRSISQCYDPRESRNDNKVLSESQEVPDFARAS